MTDDTSRDSLSFPTQDETESAAESALASEGLPELPSQNSQPPLTPPAASEARPQTGHQPPLHWFRGQRVELHQEPSLGDSSPGVGAEALRQFRVFAQLNLCLEEISPQGSESLAEQGNRLEAVAFGVSDPLNPIEEPPESTAPVKDPLVDIPEDPNEPPQSQQLDPYERIGLALIDAVRRSSTWTQDLDDWKEINRIQEADAEDTTRDLPGDINAHRLDQTRWGIVCTQATYVALESQLRPLIDYRCEQMQSRDFDPERDWEPLIYEAPHTAATFLAKLGETIGTIDPKTIPYYLLIVGGPEEIPWDFQYQLSVDHAVGRIAFDKAEDYGRYAKSVVEAEKKGSMLSKRAVVLSPNNEDDPIGDSLHRYLSEPIADRLRDAVDHWSVDLKDHDEATPADLRELYEGVADSPGLVLVSAHGALGLKHLGLEEQRKTQGAPVCRGPKKGPERYFTADSVPGEANLAGQISLLMSCYSAGTPKYDNFPDPKNPCEAFRQTPDEIAEKPFVAKLPQALLRQGASAVLGHVDRGWMISFYWRVNDNNNDKAISGLASLEDSLKQLINGERVGHAFRPLFKRGTSYSSRVAEKMDNIRRNFTVPARLLGQMWIGHNAARNFVILGDPAAYLLGQRSVGERVLLSKELTEQLQFQATNAGVDLNILVESLLMETLDPPRTPW